jgi:CRISPR/Cas system endoribonuclease Cas6 (RAMP superfamily)
MNSVEFYWGVLRLQFRCSVRMVFPPGRAANVLRGAFGMQMRENVPEDVYSRIFEPRSTRGPSGLADLPRPFVFRASHLDGLRIEVNNRFHFDMNIFDMSPTVMGACTIALENWCRAEMLDTNWREKSIRLEPMPEKVQRISVAFLTPTELKVGGGLAPTPEFGALFARARDRVATIQSMYGGHRMDCDFQALGAQAAGVRMTRCELRHVAVQRTSTRTGQTHSLGGFVGEAEYEGEGLEVFVPWLKAAEATGVGRQTTWGKGEIRVLV